MIKQALKVLGVGSPVLLGMAYLANERRTNNMTNLELPSSAQRGKGRENFTPRDDYFMAHAVLSATRSRDPVTQVGACIVDGENRIVGHGFNGMPVGLNEDDVSWSDSTDNPEYRWHKERTVVHAEVNALLFKTVPSVKGHTMYTTLFPCVNCAKTCIQAGIAKIVYLADRPDEQSFQVSREIFGLVKPHPVELKKFEPEGEKEITIDLNSSAS